jgi:hypothetical protein
VATFFTDADLIGAGEFVEAEVWLATEFTIPDGTASFRWRWPAVTPTVTPVIRVFDAGGTLVAGPLSFTTSNLSAWNATASTVFAAGTYRVTVNTNRYPALGGFFASGSITRGSITGIQSRFGSPGSAPTSTSTATYYVDIDLTPSGGGASAAPSGFAVPAALGQPATAVPTGSPTGLMVASALGPPTAALGRTAGPTGPTAAVALGTPTVALNNSAAPTGLAASVALGLPTAGRNGAAPAGLTVGSTLGTPATALVQSAAPAGLAVPVALGQPSPTEPGRAITLRPYAGTTARPYAGITPRP